MPLPASGPISMSQVMTELNNSGKTTNITLASMGSIQAVREAGFTPLNQNSTSKPDLSSPYQMSEWYSYNHTQNGNCSGSSFTTPTIGARYLYYRINIPAAAGLTTDVEVVSNGYSSGESLRCYIYTSYPFNTTGSLTGTAVSSLTFTSNTTQTYTHTFSGSPPYVLYFVIWDANIL